MSKTRRAYEHRFRTVLALVAPERAERGVRALLRRAEASAEQQGIPLARALEHLYDRVHHKVMRILEARGCAGPGVVAAWRRQLDPDHVRFLCDAGLGGLARWLRAAGHEAEWHPDVSDDELVRRGLETGAIVLTTDSHILKRGVVRRGEVKALWVPPSLTKAEQLRYVLRELRLPVRDTRCMDCGGPLEQVDKEQVKDQIPPRTYRWLDDYYRCTKCGKLYWEGTHWERIQRELVASTQGLPQQEPPCTEPH